VKWLKADKPEENTDNITADDLEISHNLAWNNYLIYKPGDETQYLTRILDKSLGITKRYHLRDALTELQERFPGVIPEGVLLFEKLPSHVPDVTMKSAWLIDKKRRPKQDIAKHIQDQQQKYMATAPSPRGWEDVAGPSTTEVLKEINRPEEQFSISHL
jgi:hypothetical protein